MVHRESCDAAGARSRSLGFRSLEAPVFGLRGVRILRELKRGPPIS